MSLRGFDDTGYGGAGAAVEVEAWFDRAAAPDPCLRLWAHVLALAIQDAMEPQRRPRRGRKNGEYDRRRNLEIDSARQWLLNPQAGGKVRAVDLCDMLGLDIGAVRRKVCRGILEAERAH